jgi:hypothetical protein
MFYVYEISKASKLLSDPTSKALGPRVEPIVLFITTLVWNFISNI